MKVLYLWSLVLFLSQCAISTQENDQMAWSVSGELIQGDKKVVTLQQNFPRPDNYTIGFSLGSQGTGANAVFSRAEALIEWIVAGNSVRRRVSIIDGCSVTGTAEAVNVTMRDVTDPALITIPTPSKYTAFAQVSRGTRGGNIQPPILYAGEFLVPVGGAVVVPVPLDAGIISVKIELLAINPAQIPIPPGTANISQQFIGAVTKEFSTTDLTIAYENWIPIVPGINSLLLDNQAPGGPPNYKFTVVFGIDG